MSKKNSEIKLLAPAGDLDGAKAAILGGANAIYLGLPQFNARKRATNIPLEELKKLTSLAHSYQCQIFITINVLLSEEELPLALKLAKEAWDEGADAIIVQDVGFMKLLHESYPEIEIHASTQMTLHNSYQLPFIKSLGANQVNYLRELSAAELAPIMKVATQLGIKNELFIHGAYCLSCSGICYMSGVSSAQPGNRGACVQPCRRGYSLSPREEKFPYLSLKDNFAIHQLSQMILDGVDTLKIEGRIKDYRYVYETTQSYRNLLDEESQSLQNRSEAEKRIAEVFNRDFSDGYYQGLISEDQFQPSPMNQALTPCGEVKTFNADFMELQLFATIPLEAEQKIAVYRNDGTFIAQVRLKQEKRPQIWTIQFENLLKGKIYRGDLLFLYPQFNDETQLFQAIRSLQPKKIPLDLSLSGNLNAPLEATFSLKAGENSPKTIMVTVKSTTALSLAQNRGLDVETFHKQFSRLGDTPFALNEITLVEEFQTVQPLFLPIKELNEMRREGVELLGVQFAQFSERRVVPPRQEVILPSTSSSAKGDSFPKGKIALFSSDVQDIALLQPDELLFLEFHSESDPHQFSSQVRPWIGAIIPSHEGSLILDKIKSIPAGIVICENAGIGHQLGKLGISWIAGPQLNITNSQSLAGYVENANAQGGFYSTEINRGQILAIQEKTNHFTAMKIFGPLHLMTTCQCLYRRVLDCPQKKATKDAQCLHHCQQNFTLYDEKEFPIHLIKEKGFETQLFNNAILSIPEAPTEINANLFLIDFRELPFFKLSQPQKKKILASLQGKTDENINEILATETKLTRGNYKRGFNIEKKQTP